MTEAAARCPAAGRCQAAQGVGKDEMLKGVGERTWGGADLGRGGLGKGCSSTGAGVIRFLPNYTRLCPPWAGHGPLPRSAPGCEHPLRPAEPARGSEGPA